MRKVPSHITTNLTKEDGLKYEPSSINTRKHNTIMDKKKRVRRGESFGRMGVDRSISNSLKCPTKQKQRQNASSINGDVDNTASTATKQLEKQQNTVRFAEQTPLQYICSHYDEGMTPEQQAGRREELWYSVRDQHALLYLFIYLISRMAKGYNVPACRGLDHSQAIMVARIIHCLHLTLFFCLAPPTPILKQKLDFEGFLKDRVATIRLLKMVQGDAAALRDHCPEVCLRGLEPYESNPLNQELQCQREWHQRVVLAEQTLQKKEKRDSPDRIRQLAVERSEWAGERARQLASLDEMEVKLADAEPQLRRRSLASAQIGMQNLSMLSQQRQQQRRRASLSLTSGANVGRTPSQRAPVDMAILKEWNAKFMEDMRKKGSVPTPTSATSAAPTLTGMTTGSTPGSTSMASAISSLSEKTARSRMALRRQSDSLMSPGVAASMATNGTRMGLGYGELLTSNKDATAACFRFPVRRDSLVAFRRESLLANRTAALAGVAASTSSSGTSPAAATGGFRFPVRRDSLSNVHWS